MKLPVWSGRKTRTLIWVSLFCLIAPLSSTLLFLEEFTWERLLFAQKQGFFAALLIIVLLFAYHITIRKIITPVLHPERHKFRWLFVGTVVAILLLLLGAPVEISLLAGIALNTALALIFKNHLVWDALFSSFGLAALFVLIGIVTSTVLPSPLDDLWLSVNTTGALFLGIPVRELSTLGLLGMLWGPLLSALKEPSEIIVETVSTHLKSKRLGVKMAAVSLLLVGTVGVSSWFSYTYLLKPQRVSAKVDSLEAVPLDAEIVLVFARPASSTDIKLSVTPDIPGTWEFRDTGLGNRTFRSLAFIPSEVFTPEQEYIIEAQDVNTVIGSGGETHRITFKSEPLPKVATVTPVDGTSGVKACSPISVEFDRPLSDYWQPSFTLTPARETTVTKTDALYTIIPNGCLEQGTTYQLSVALDTIDTPATSPTSLSTFQTITAPGLQTHSPQGDAVYTTEKQFAITFSKAMSDVDPSSVATLSPSVPGSWNWNEDKTILTYSFSEVLTHNTEYTATIKKGITDAEGGVFAADATVSFRTIGAVKVSSASPGSGSKDVKIEAVMQLKFSQEIDRQSAETRFTVSPEIQGSFSWSGTTLIFTPKSPLSYSSTYTFGMKNGVTSVHGLPLEKDYSASFTTKAAPIPPATPIVMGLSEQGRAIYGYIFGSGSNVIFIHGGIHGGKERSNVSLLERFVKEVNANQSLVGSGNKVVIVPNANPDGYYTRTDKYNARGVNININFQTVGWIPWGISDEAPNAGPEPFSERESRVIKEISQKYGADTMVAFHSKGGLVNPEYGHGPSQDLARQYAKASGYAYYEVPEWDYPGTATKWFIENGGGPSITVELTSHTVADWSVHKNALFGLID